MKRNLLSLLVAFAAVLPMKALDYESARQQAWFLTDKMAYELNLTNEQYDRAYQINLDYFLSVNNPSDAFGYSWSWRNEDLRYVLFDWQYRLYSTVDYFLRPIRWSGFRWYYPVFDRYRYGYYYFGRPAIYLSYRGGFGHRPHHGGVSPYHGMHFSHGPGMRDTHRPPKKGWGEGRNFRNDGRPADRSGGGYNRPGHNGGGNPGGHNGGGYNGGSNNRPGGNSGNVGGGSNNRPSGNSGSVGGSSNNRPSGNSGSVGGSSRPSGSHSGSGSFGRSGSRGSVSGGGRSTGSRPSGNTGGGNSSSGRRFGR
ncbi:MAG: hypothetical protein IJ692_00865 [Alloprevotella sp.]|nr:hypothetical protein [Alloprevotella sp.]